MRFRFVRFIPLIIAGFALFGYIHTVSAAGEESRGGSR